MMRNQHHFLRFIIALLFSFMIPFELSSQRKKAEHVLTADEAKIVKKDAATLFASEDYKGALSGYRDLIKTDPGNSEYNYRLGVSILRTSTEKSSALQHLQMNANSKDAKKDIDFYLGLAYMHNIEWDKAVESFNLYKTKAGGKAMKGFPSVDRLIEMSENGKEICKQPLNVKFENAGKIINTSYEEYNPFISADGKNLYFTSRRKGNIGGFIEDLGIYTSDIYGSQWRDTVWTKPRSFGGLVNGEWDEELVGMSAAGDMAIIYFDNAEFYADLGYSTLKGKAWQKPQMFPVIINSKQYEGAGCISLDGSTLIFSGVKKEGLGGIDLWTAKKDPNGIWGSVQNLGLEINTSYDDNYPYLSLDGKTLYFASKGHNSMGDYDLFKSHYDDRNDVWQKPVNLGYPINTADDNHSISFTGDQRFAYVTSNLNGGYGNQDIWRIEFQDTTIQPFKTLITGNVVSETGTRINLTKITLENIETMELLVYKPAASGNNFVLNAKPGKYKLSAEGTNFVSKTIDLEIENVFPPEEIKQEITVTPSK